MITTDLTTLKINKLTKAQYEAALAAGTISENELYFTPESESEGGGSSIASYNFPEATVKASDMIEAIEKFNSSKAIIIWNGVYVKAALYDPNESLIYISFADQPFAVYKYVISSTGDIEMNLEIDANISYVNEFVADKMIFIENYSSPPHAKHILDAYDGVLQLNETPIAYKRRFETYMLRSSEWDATTKTYSFESIHPNASYDIEVHIDGDNCTDEQLEAWIVAKPLSSSTNKIVAKGDIPTVDIPVILTITPLRYELV